MIRMGVVRDLARLKGEKESVIKFLAHFNNVASWDPGVKSEKRVGNGSDLAVGSRNSV